MTILEQYAELIGLAQLYLLQEHKMTDRILSGSQEYLYFKEYALKRQTKPSTPVPQPPTTPQKIVNTLPVPSFSQKEAPHSPVVVETIADNVETKRTASPPPSPPTAKLTPKIETKDESKKTNAGPQGFVPAVLKEVEPTNLSEIHKAVVESLPGKKLLDTTPNDDVARARSRAWEQQAVSATILLLSFDDDLKHQHFLKDIQTAFNFFGFDAKSIQAKEIESNDGWNEILSSDQWRLVIGTESGINSLPLLSSKHLKVKEDKQYLGDIPVLFIADISTYLKDPSSKALLWKTIKEFISGMLSE